MQKKIYRLLPHRMSADDNRCRPSSLLLPLLICTGLLFSMDIFQLVYYKTYSTAKKQLPPQPGNTEELALKGFLIKTPGCRIPDMDPFDPSVKRYIKKGKRPNCNNGLPSLVESNLTSLYINISSLGAYGINDTYQLKCCYKAFWKKVTKNNRRDGLVQFSKNCIEFSESVNVIKEFVSVECYFNSSMIYLDFFAFVPLKNLMGPKNMSRSPLNVLVVGLDAVSRINLHRQLPNTLKYLKKLNSIELLGYNKVGDDTFSNLIPVLTGLTIEELQKNCWNSLNNYFDACPFVWKDYKKNGFVTSFGEDSAWMGLFYYQKKGFITQPTDYMWGFFNLISENYIGNERKMNVNQCVASREVYKTLLDYIVKFVKTMCHEKRPYFGFYWGASLSHDFLNMPSLGDDDYKYFFKELYETGCLNQTALIFMSDHGIRWGKIRLTYQGRMEEKLPFLHLILPKWYREEFSLVIANLQKNVRRLTTPFDLHETLKDLLNPYEITSKLLETKDSKKKRGYSLFEKISVLRTCEDAEIASHWCTCRDTVVVNKNDPIIWEAANFTVNYINAKLEDYADCAYLTLDEIINARIHTHGEHILNGDSNIVDYTLTIRTVPGDGIFEVTVHAFLNENRFAVTGTISRLNLYGKQSLCITDFHLKLYCYCKSFL